MDRGDILDARTTRIGDAPVRGDARWVLYWMQRAGRAEDNPALEVAVRHANALGLPVLVAFGLDDGYPGANLRMMAYLVEGLADVADGLQRRGVAFAPRLGAPDEVALTFARDAALVVCDRGPLRHQRAWRRRLAAESPVRVERVDADVVVPSDLVTDRREHAARTIRPKIWRHAERFLTETRPVTAETRRPDLDPGDVLPRFDPRDLAGTLRRLRVDREVPPVATARAGTRAAKLGLRAFLDARFARYAAHRNQPQEDDVARISAALHFGHLSPVVAAVRAREAAPDEAALNAFLEELIVRRELAVNYVLHEDDYDRWSAVPEWARATLDAHRGDAREHLYDDATLEAAGTHDEAWNAAMREMRTTGYMHNHMRMYWGKRILAWSADPEEGFARTLRLNDRWFLDGRDANSYAGVAWCYGVHDRPWPEREVFGKVRSMTAGGLKRKADPEAYVRKVARLARAEADADRARFGETGEGPRSG